MQQKAIIYCRVSSVKQSTEGHGLDSQEHRCREYAQREGYEVVKVFRDSFTGSGDFMNRPAMSSLLGFLDENPATNFIVIFDDLKRFARDVEFHFKLRFAFKARGATLFCLNYTFDESDEGEFIELIMAGQAQLERKQNRRQVIQKMKARLEKGYWAIVAPVGYKMKKDSVHGNILIKDEPDATIIKEALEGFSSGRFSNQVEVQKFLQSKNFRNLKHVSLDSVKKILTNCIYPGYVEYKLWDVSRRIGHHEPIISLEAFEQIQNRLNGKMKVFSRKDNNKEFPLRGFVLCDECLKPMTASWTTGRNGKHPYYHCKTIECSLRGKTVRRKEMEEGFENILHSIKPKEQTLALTKEILLDVWNKRIKDVDNIKKSHENKLSELHKKVENIIERISKTENEKIIQSYEKELERLSNEEQVLENQVQVMRNTKPDFGTALDMTFKFLKSPYLYWMKDDLKAKQLVLKLVFEDQIPYNRENGFGTAKLALPLRIFESNETNDSCDVDPSGFEPLTSGVQNRRSTK